MSANRYFYKINILGLLSKGIYILSRKKNLTLSNNWIYFAFTYLNISFRRKSAC